MKLYEGDAVDLNALSTDGVAVRLEEIFSRAGLPVPRRART